MAVRRRQRGLLRAVEASPVRYSDSPGISLDNPVVITGAENDILGTMAVLAWLIRKRGTMDVDWKVLVKSGHHDGEVHIDIYRILMRDGVEETFYFDISESWGKLGF